MLDHILTVELPIPAGREEEWNRWYHEEHMPSLLAEVPAISRGTRYRLLSGDPEYGYIVVYEFPLADALRDFMHSAVIRRNHGEYRARWGTINRRSAFARVFRMARGAPGGPVRPVRSPANLGESPRQILTVRLTVPSGQEAEWNRWYHEEHMPSVMGQVGSILVGHRLAPFESEPEAPYFVIYEFASADALNEWQVSTAVTQRREEYFERWGVRNTRRAFEAVFILNGNGQPNR